MGANLLRTHLSQVEGDFFHDHPAQFNGHGIAQQTKKFGRGDEDQANDFLLAAAGPLLSV